jgi:hypothetical protein
MRSLTLGLLALLTACATREVGPQDRISISEAESAYEVSVPLSRLIMTVPKGAIVRDTSQRGGAMDSPRYFRFHDRASGTILSGWFEPASRYVDLRHSLKVETESLGEPLDLEEGTIGGMRVLSYYLAVPRGNSAHIRASYIGAGTWVDIHASVTADRSRDEVKKQVSALVSSIAFRRKQ